MAELEADEDPESPSVMHVDDSAAEAESEAASIDRDEQRRQILDTVAASDGFFKHQQRNEPDLTYEEKRKIAEEILDSNTALFLQRFSRYLYCEDASYFEPLRRTDYEVDFYLRELERKRQRRGLSVQTKNRRYEALQRLQSEGDYFSDKEVRRRNPLLFEQMVGRYMTDKEREDLDKMDYSTLTFSGLLMHHIDRNELSSRRRQQQDVEEATFEENDSDSEDEECDEPDTPVVSATEKAMLRSEFMNTMYESFLSGKDHDYDYESVDNNAEYDSLKTRQDDEEEKYFDAEEPEVVDAVT